MIVFPQLLTHCIAQYPIRSQLRYRRVVNTAPGGQRIVWSDERVKEVRWIIPYAGLTKEEIQKIEECFSTVGGTLRPFVFLDPVDNLLLESERLTDSPWDREPGLEIGIRPSGEAESHSIATITNTTSAFRRISQTIQIPSQFTYCLSCKVQLSSAIGVRIGLSDGAKEASQDVRNTATWTRQWCTASLGSNKDELTVFIEMPPTSTIDLCCIQLEAQVSPSAYRPTFERSGVYPNARFASDTLSIGCDGPGSYSVNVGIVASV
jgi:hypothetical protein